MTAVPAELPARVPAAVRGAAGPAAADDITFASLGVSAPLVAVLAETGITTPFPIQAATLPDALAGLDILGRAQTGSGKTLGFSLPMVSRLADGETEPGRPRGLVLVPTRELATQVNDVLAPLAHAMGLRVATVYGGVSYRPQVAALRRATDILVACPGRLADLIEQGVCDLSDVEVTVIDEADQMADLGFLPIVRRLLDATPADGQRLLFSATLDSAIDVLARRFLHDPALHSVGDSDSPAEIEHHVITIQHAHRLEVLAALAGGEKRSLVFTRTKHGAERLARQLTAAGIPAAELHGNLRQGARARNLAAFTSGIARVMVATDIAARGIHVDGIDLVIHADPPAEHKAYVHRSGRTARGGADGVVVTMQTASQAREVRKLMREAGVSPRVAEASPESEVLREIAGSPAPRVKLTKPVTDLVRLPRPGADRTRPGRAGSDRSRADRTGSDRQRGERARRDRTRPDRARSERPRTERPERLERRDRFEHADRRSRDDRADRSSRDGRPARRAREDVAQPERNGNDWYPRPRAKGNWRGPDQRRDDQRRDDRRRDDRRPDTRASADRRRDDRRRDDRNPGGERRREWIPASEWRRAGADRPWSGSSRPVRDDRGSGAAGGRGGSTRRPEDSAGQGPAGKRGKYGQGRHF